MHQRWLTYDALRTALYLEKIVATRLQRKQTNPHCTYACPKGITKMLSGAAPVAMSACMASANAAPESPTAAHDTKIKLTV